MAMPGDAEPAAEGVTPLMYACQQGNEKECSDILHKKPGAVRQRDRTQKTALHYCVENVNTWCADALLKVCPDGVNARDEDGYSPLHLAVIAGNKPLIQLLTTRGADINALDHEKHSVVHWATVCGEQEALELVLRAGASISCPDIHGGYPLHYAAQMCGPGADVRGDSKAGLSVLTTLLAYGADVDERDKDGRQPILWAASADGHSRDPRARFRSSGSAEAILALVKAGAQVESTDKDGLTALHCAASRGHTDCLETLVALCGAQVDTIDINGCTALFYAATLGHADATQLLLNLGAEPNRQDRKGRTPAHCGAAKGQLETLRLLLSGGANLWLRNVKGDLPLHEAVASGRRELVAWLLNQRPESVNVANNDGKCPIHVGSINNNVEIIKILLDAGSLVNPVFRSNKGEMVTPLDAALLRGHRSTAKFLQLHGGVPRSKLSDTSLSLRGPLPSRDCISTAMRMPGPHFPPLPLSERIANDLPSVRLGPDDVAIRHIEHIPRPTQNTQEYSEDDRRSRKKLRRRKSERRKRSDESSSEYSEESSNSSRQHRKSSRRRKSKGDAKKQEAKNDPNSSDDKKKTDRFIKTKGDKINSDEGPNTKESNDGKKGAVDAKPFNGGEQDAVDKKRAYASNKTDSVDNKGSNGSKEKSQPSGENEELGEGTSLKKGVDETSLIISNGNPAVTANVDSNEGEAIKTNATEPCEVNKLDEPVECVNSDQTKKPETDNETTTPAFVANTQLFNLDSSLEDNFPPTSETLHVEAEVHQSQASPSSDSPGLDQEKDEKEEEHATLLVTSVDEAPLANEEPTGLDSPPPAPASLELLPPVQDINPIDVPKVENIVNSETEPQEDNPAVEDVPESTKPPILHFSSTETLSDGDTSVSRPVTARRRSVVLETANQENHFNVEKDVAFYTLPDSIGTERRSADGSEGLPTEEKSVLSPVRSGRRSSCVFGEPLLDRSRSSRGKRRRSDGGVNKTSRLGRRQSLIKTESERDGTFVPEPDIDTVIKSVLLAESQPRHRSIISVGEDLDNQYDDSSMLPDSGIEPSPGRGRNRSSPSPSPSRRFTRVCQRGKGPAAGPPVSVTRTVQSTIRKYHLERKLFYQLLELKRLQIRAGRANEQVLVKRLVDDYQKTSTAAGLTIYNGNFSFRQFERFLYDQLHHLQSGKQFINMKINPSDDIETLSAVLKRSRGSLQAEMEEDVGLCKHITHRCRHAAHAYTGIPCAAYITKLNHHTMPKETDCGFLPRINVGASNSKKRVSGKPCDRPVTLEVINGREKQVISLPTDHLDRSKRYFVTFSIKGGDTTPRGSSPIPDGHLHAKTV